MWGIERENRNRFVGAGLIAAWQNTLFVGSWRGRGHKSGNPAGAINAFLRGSPSAIEVSTTLPKDRAVGKRGNAWTGARLRPLRQRVRRGHECPGVALSRIVGKELSATWVDRLRRVSLASAASPHDARSLRRDGGIKGKRYTARVRLDASAKRSVTDPEVVGLVLLLMHIWDHIRPGQRRACTRALWLGVVKRSHKRQPPHSLSRALGVGVRELQRWLAALRTIGALSNWQPPGAEVPPYARTRKGRAYSCYQIGDYGEAWGAWQAQRVRGEKREERAAAIPAVAPQLDSRGQESARVAMFAAMAPPPPRAGPS